MKQVLGNTRVDENLEVLSSFSENVLGARVELRVVLLLLLPWQWWGGVPVELVIVRLIHCGFEYSHLGIDG